jgi:hypothetical protein
MVKRDPARWLTIYFPDPTLLRRLKEYCKVVGMKVSVAAREALDFYLKHHGF